MPIIDKKDRNNWYNCIPEQADPVKRWEGFSADKLKGNEIRCGEMILAKIPQVPGLISRKTRRNEYGSSTTYIELITERRYDREKHQTRNRRVCIGTDISHIYRGMMIINEKYHEYFNSKGQLVFTPLIEKREKSAETEKKTDNGKKTDPKKQTGIKEEAAMMQEQEGLTIETSGSDGPEETEAGERKIGTGVEENDREIQEEMDRKEHMKDRVEFLYNLLMKYDCLVEEQMGKRPDLAMSRNQIRRINELLQDIRQIMQPFEFSEYLQPAEEENEESGNQMTYADMAVLLKNYICVMNSYKFGRLWYRPNYR